MRNILALFAAAAALAQTPAPSNLPGVQYPQIHSDLRVTFRLNAPTARSVQLIPGGKDNGLGAGPYELTRDDKGAWTVTIPPVVPGFHYYWFSVDGFPANDPGTRTYFGWNKECSGIDVPDPKLDFYNAKDVPHGDVREHWYFAKTTNTWRRAIVYTPPGYDRDVKTRYPVLYLQHGSGENERGWTQQGRANFILDNLLAAGKTRPMIVVMENGMDAGKRNEAFAQVVLHDLIPHIDATYRTLTPRTQRAIAGLSMGSGQAAQIGLGNLDKFAYVGLFSGRAPQAEFDPAQLKLLYIGAGTAEPTRVTDGKAYIEAARKKGVKAVWYEAQGTSHEWETWRLCLHDFAPRLFRD